MARGVIAAVLAVGMLAPTPSLAQSPTDFSGTWTWLAVSDSKAKTKTLSMRITQTATELKVERVYEGGARESVSYRLDGAESSNRIGNAAMRTKAAWKDGALMLTTTPPTGGAPESTTLVYRIVDGDLVIETTRQDASGRVTITKETFRKGQ